MLLSSLKTNVEISSLVQHLFPSNPTLENYSTVLEKLNFLRFFVNTFLYTAAVTLISIYTSTLAGFVFSKYSFKGRSLLFSGIIMTMMIPGVVTIIPRYSIIQAMGLIDTFSALILPSIFTSFGIFLMRQACSGIPDEMLDAARIDGAGEIYIFHRIVIPMTRNAISSITIFQFLWAWEDYLWPYLVMRSEEKQLLSVALNLFNGRYSTNYAGLFAAASIAIVPVIIFYLIFQKSFIEGVSSSAIKG
jgi:multiple sugar transport system permease protein/raffinose/stachyose/melibiose transport system permease protein